MTVLTGSVMEKMKKTEQFTVFVDFRDKLFFLILTQFSVSEFPESV